LLQPALVPDEFQNAKQRNGEIRQERGVPPRILRDSTREIEISRHVDDVARQADDDLRRLRDRSATLTANARAKVSRRSERAVSLMRAILNLVDFIARKFSRNISRDSANNRATSRQDVRSVTRWQLLCLRAGIIRVEISKPARDARRMEVSSPNSGSGFCFGLVRECDSVFLFLCFPFFLHARFRARRGAMIRSARAWFVDSGRDSVIISRFNSYRTKCVNSKETRFRSFPFPFLVSSHETLKRAQKYRFGFNVAERVWF